MGGSEQSHKMCHHLHEKFSDSVILFGSLDESLLYEILARLPSRNAIQLKLVCRRWHSLISSDYFITVYNHRRHDTSLPLIRDRDSPSYSLVLQLAHHTSLIRCGYTYSCARLYNHRMIDLSFLPCSQSSGNIMELNASCADLILCSYKRHPLSRTKFYYVCNILTTQWVALPPAFHFTDQAIGFLWVNVLAPCSLCHCNGSNQCVQNIRHKFMVVQIIAHENDLPLSEFEVHLFSSEDAQWRRLTVLSPRTLNVSRPNSYSRDFLGKSYDVLVPYKGMLHWLTSDCVVVYDPYDSPEGFSHLIDLPLESDFQYTCSSIAVCQDRLRVGLFCSAQGSYDIWELEDYEEEKWTLVHKICTRSLNLFPHHLFPDKYILYIHPDGNVFYKDGKNSSIQICNFQSGTINHVYELIDCESKELDLEHRSVLQISDQDWPTPVPLLLQNV
ncbi:unnamed protein product [Cuscuta epithymum]|uniref:F-box domain-containing protein n=1 Tax=Cuscuta epithymum TaxID=186058 RepID=A0AAV0G4W9_9ASTE|nr:unnamed protein product [Cuscuta epithymum]